ncbi:MAG TPA: zinc-ribbon domain-containing protein [Terriglobia bacterium]|nr:zinc-ribbon domain-containing protein [Terriglobia bacterium]
MAFCSKCGAQMDQGSAFCIGCGQAAGPAQAANAPGASLPPPVASTPIASNMAALLTYIVGFITGIIFLVIEPYKRDPFVRFHAFQSIFFSAACIVISIAWSMVFGALFFATLGVMWQFLLVGWILLRLAFFVLWLFLMYKAYNNERFMLPVIGPLAASQAR